MTLTTPFGSTFTFGHCSLSLADGMLAGLILAVCLCLSAYRRHSLFQKFCYLLLYTYLGALISLTIPIILPGAWNLSSASTAYAFKNINVVPFTASWEILKNSVLIDNYREFWRLIGGNLILLMPLGLLVPAISKRFGTLQMFLTALFTSLGIETLHIPFTASSTGHLAPRGNADEYASHRLSGCRMPLYNNRKKNCLVLSQ